MEDLAYYNTTNQSGPLYDEYVAKAKTQNDFILRLLKKRRACSPSTMQAICRDVYNKRWPLTSIRRAFSNLTKKGELIKTSMTIKSYYGRPEYLWAIKND